MEACPVCQLAVIESTVPKTPGTASLGLDALPWRAPAITDHEVVDLLLAHPQPLSGYSPATLLAWRHSHRYRWLPVDGSAWLACAPIEACRGDVLDEGLHLLQPVGTFTTRAQTTLLQLLSQEKRRVKLLGVSSAFVERHPHFCAHFEIEADDAGANYIYSARELAELAGGRFQKKRNLVAQAARAYRWTVEPLGPSNRTEAMIIARELASEAGPESTLFHERRACEESLTHLECFGLEGLLIRVEGRAVAFSIFERQSPDRAVIHFEKALREYKGLYQVINNETAKLLWSRGFLFLNREEDLGDDGLRQAKLSYNPVQLEPSLALTYRHSRA